MEISNHNENNMYSFGSRSHISSLDEYKTLIQAVKRQYGSLINNAYFFYKAMEEPISQGRLSYQNIPGGLIVFLDNGSYENAYFFVNEKYVEEKIVIQKSKTIVTNLITNVDKEIASIPTTEKAIISAFDEKNLKMVRFLETNNFYVEDAYFHMHRIKAGIQIHTMDGYRATYATCDMIDEILEMLTDAFRGYTSDLPTKYQMFHLIEEQKGLVLVCNNNEVCGYIQCEKIGVASFIRHVVISDKYKGKGLGKFFVQSVLKDYACDECVLWIKSNNIIAYNLYQKCDFTFDGRVMVNYII